MHDRAPIIWMNPNFPNCKYCNQTNCVKPIISDKRSINWLLLLLGQKIGCCKTDELKYFCRQTKNHRTGCKLGRRRWSGTSLDLLKLQPTLPCLTFSLILPCQENNVNDEENTAKLNVATRNHRRVGLTARARRTSNQSIKEGKSEIITPPYPWVTSRRAIVHTLDYLISNEITIISGEVQCKKCEGQYQIRYDLQEKFKEIATFISKTKSTIVGSVSAKPCGWGLWGVNLVALIRWTQADTDHVCTSRDLPGDGVLKDRSHHLQDVWVIPVK
ncbi:hypothetical protein RND71_038760 [Anisodus tanguticus]|uniref:DUF7086 domain-containing protein n=1 Tax=Anisodus tanguticus TaxID=243964 RepID=A0AAE1QZM8_9SOLA|nr:hypothetical protein RND71_038760 [Anisodus tanguticus]